MSIVPDLKWSYNSTGTWFCCAVKIYRITRACMILTHQCNNIEWLMDTPHSLRYISSMSFSILCISIVTLFFPLVLYRTIYYQPLRAHGVFFQCWKYLGFLYCIIYYSFFGLMNRMFIGMYIANCALFYIMPTLYR